MYEFVRNVYMICVYVRHVMYAVYVRMCVCYVCMLGYATLRYATLCYVMYCMRVCMYACNVRMYVGCVCMLRMRDLLCYVCYFMHVRYKCMLCT